MEIIRMSFFGNPNIGVYAFTNNEVLLLPPGIGDDDIKEMADILKVAAIPMKIAGTALNGVFVAGNDRALILPRIIFEEELEHLNKYLKENSIDLRVYISSSRATALGNLLTCNNRGCIASYGIEKEELARIADALGVEVVQAKFLGIDISGSLVSVNDRGGVAHPDLSDDDLKTMSDILKVSVERATVNAGSPYIKSGLLANNNGVVVGGNTTGPEVLRIKRGFEGGGYE